MCAVIVACVCAIGVAHAAQNGVRSVNPEALEFEVPSGGDSDETAYRVEIFAAEADTSRDTPAQSIELGPSAVREEGRIRVDVARSLGSLPDGSYVATIAAVHEGLDAVRSAPGEPFVIARGSTPEQRAETERQERRWTKIAIAIGASLLILPFIF